MASEADILNMSSNMVTKVGLACSGLCLIIELVYVAFFRIIFRFYIVFFYFQNDCLSLSHSQYSQEDSDSPCELEAGEVGEEMSLWTGGRVKAQETLGGDLEVYTSFNGCL